MKLNPYRNVWGGFTKSGLQLESLLHGTTHTRLRDTGQLLHRLCEATLDQETASEASRLG